MSIFQSLLNKIIGRLNTLQGKGWGDSTNSDEVRQILKRVHSPKTVVDVGGNVGDWTASLLALSEPSRVFIFEPSTVNQEKLRHRFLNHPSVKLLPLALSDRDGVATLFSNASGSGLASLHQRNLEHMGIEHKEVEKVKLKAFRSFCTEENIDFIDILKLDIEGHELTVLNAIPEEWREKIGAIQFEFGGCNIDSRTYFQDFWNLLSSRYRFYRMTPLGLTEVPKYREQDEHFSTTNYLCIRR